MHVRIRGAIGIAAVAVALVAAGLVVGQRTAVSHAGHS